LSASHRLLLISFHSRGFSYSLPHFRLYRNVIGSASHELLLLLSLLSGLGDASLHSIESLNEERLISERDREGVDYFRGNVFHVGLSESFIRIESMDKLEHRTARLLQVVHVFGFEVGNHSLV